MSCEGSLAFCMSKSAFFVGPVVEHRWGLDKMYKVGAIRVPGSALYLKAVTALHLSDEFSPLLYQIVCS